MTGGPTTGVPWTDADHRNHPPEPHYCRCRCSAYVDPHCSEHGWQVRDQQPASDGDLSDVVHADGSHSYRSTHCRHGNHAACSATELAPGVPRRPSQCKNCHAPCLCTCHKETR